MVQRSPPKSKLDERNYPIRLKFLPPPRGLEQNGWAIEKWLRDNLGDRDHAVHMLSGHVGVYVRALADAQRFVDAFPDLKLADGIAEEYGIRKPRLPHQGWSHLAAGSKQ